MAEALNAEGIPSAALHGGLSQVLPAMYCHAVASCRNADVPQACVLVSTPS